MIDEIIKLRRRGLSFRKIAKELDTTVGKVQYQWTKLIQNKAKRNKADPLQMKSSGTGDVKESAACVEDTISLIRITDEKLKVSWELSAYTRNMVARYFNAPFSTWMKALRIYDVTGVIFDGGNVRSDHEVVISDNHTEWIFKGLKPNRVYCIDLGIRVSENTFFPLLRSEALYTSEAAAEYSGKLEERNQKSAKWAANVSTYTYYEMGKGEQ